MWSMSGADVRTSHRSWATPLEPRRTHWISRPLIYIYKRPGGQSTFSTDSERPLNDSSARAPTPKLFGFGLGHRPGLTLEQQRVHTDLLDVPLAAISLCRVPEHSRGTLTRDPQGFPGPRLQRALDTNTPSFQERIGPPAHLRTHG